MSQFERDLRESLRRRQPPEHFAAGVLAKTQEKKIGKAYGWRWLAAAALVVFMVGGVSLIHEQRRQAENEKAKEQLMVALRITGSKLRDVRARLSATQQRVVYPHLDQ
jgi:hypothetical protein